MIFWSSSSLIDHSMNSSCIISFGIGVAVGLRQRHSNHSNLWSSEIPLNDVDIIIMNLQADRDLFHCDWFKCRRKQKDRCLIWSHQLYSKLSVGRSEESQVLSFFVRRGVLSFETFHWAPNVDDMCCVNYLQDQAISKGGAEVQPRKNCVFQKLFQVLYIKK